MDCLFIYINDITDQKIILKIYNLHHVSYSLTKYLKIITTKTKHTNDVINQSSSISKIFNFDRFI